MRKLQTVGWFSKLLALGIIGCGGTILYSGITFISQSSQPYKENLQALAGTIQELDRTVMGLRSQSSALSKYLEFLEKSLAKTKLDLSRLDSDSARFLELTGGSSVKLLDETAEAVTTAAKLMRDTSNDAGKVPFDPLADKRKLLYSISDTFTSIATELKATAGNISQQAHEFKELSSSSLGTTRQVIELTEEQVALLRQGPVERMPVVLEALSVQLTAHIKLINSSYDLLNTVSQPVIAVGIGFILIGLRGLLMRQSSVIAS